MKLLFLGDIFTETDHNLKPKADYIFGNLEGPLGGTDVFPAKRIAGGKRLALKSNPKFVKKLNLSAVSLANNHIWDYGFDGFQLTRDYLDEWDWRWTGAGKHELIQEPIHRQGYKIYLFAYSWHEWPMTTSYKLDGEGAIDISRSRIRRDIQNRETGKNIIKIVSLHWGFENEVLPMPSQQRLAHDIIDWGADIVVGTHPHVIQGLEPYKDGLIMYSLGNFLFQFKNRTYPVPDESIGVYVNPENFHDYQIEVYKGNKTSIMKRIRKYNKQLRSKDYNRIWRTERLRKNLPGTAFGYTYNDTFDKF